ncbi:hypothetical protein I6M49_21685 [Shewanella algae]|uniref:hypothetical protein n=1 Tax=Shewanella algae TaxID=38313 RepID=UPI001AADA0EB|nr:hypothetical protein [Shewanella algae]MBO2656059.1 hypothetical protein [Shewanella algae]
MTLFFSGFDTLSDSSPLQEQTQLQLNTPAGVSLVAGRAYGKALEFAPDSFATLLPIDGAANSVWGVYAGFAVKYSGAGDGQNLVFACVFAPPAGADLPTLLAHSDKVALHIEDGALVLSGKTLESRVISTLPADKWVYVEVRLLRDVHNTSLLRVYVNGLKYVEVTPFASTDQSTLEVVTAAPGAGMTMILDDLYVEYGHTDTPTVPVLGSAKIAPLPLTQTISNSFDVTGTTAHDALSDNNDSTYISSDVSAEATFAISQEVGEVFGLNLTLRGASPSGAGAVRVALQHGETTGDEYALGLSEDIQSHTVNSVDKPGTGSWGELLRDGMNIKVIS